ncbi:MAG: hypothetical protein IJT94_10995 [Oscillibacter sp.]|nr:hypothetical protein [Oscillibacter sp.]
MTALERLAQAAGKTGTGTTESGGTAAGAYETGISTETSAGTSFGTNAAAAVNLDFLVTVTVSVVQVPN